MNCIKPRLAGKHGVFEQHNEPPMTSTDLNDAYRYMDEWLLMATVPKVLMEIVTSFPFNDADRYMHWVLMVTVPKELMEIVLVMQSKAARRRMTLTAMVWRQFQVSKVATSRPSSTLMG